MRVMVVGLRGVPGVEGGIESHVEKLYPRLVAKNLEVEVIARNEYHPKDKASYWQGLKITRIWAPRKSGLEAFIHTFLAVLYAAIKRPNVIHFHGIGPGIFAPLARFFALRVVVTHHGPDYDREKWGKFSRWVLRTGELLSMKFSHQRIVISHTIQNNVRHIAKVDSTLIPNGVERGTILPTQTIESSSICHEFGLCPGKYVLQVSRFVPEKRQNNLIDAFKQAQVSDPKLKDWKLVLVGSIDDQDEYCQQIKSSILTNPNIHLLGFRRGIELAEILSQAGVFVLPSTHEGLPIALLEALSYGLRVIASDIPANAEVGLQDKCYFPVGNIDALAESLQFWANSTHTAQSRRDTQEWVLERFNWDDIATTTHDLLVKTAS